MVIESSMPYLMVPTYTTSYTTIVTSNSITTTLVALTTISQEFFTESHTTTHSRTITASDQSSTSSPRPTATKTSPWPSDDSQSSGVPDPNTQTYPNINGTDKHTINYYFILFAVVFSIGALTTLILFRQRRKLLRRYNNNRQQALAQDVQPLQPMPSERRYGRGHISSLEISREEGLNEVGGAPPPYMPKPDEQTAPDLPFRTLSRQQAGLPPPEYEETITQVNDNQGRPAVSQPGCARYS